MICHRLFRKHINEWIKAASSFHQPNHQGPLTVMKRCGFFPISFAYLLKTSLCVCVSKQGVAVFSFFLSASDQLKLDQYQILYSGENQPE